MTNKSQISKHDKGVNEQPYEAYHLTADQAKALSRPGGVTTSGILPAIVYNNIIWVLPPVCSNSPGKAGQKAIDSKYIYICVKNNVWKRAALESSF